MEGRAAPPKGICTYAAHLAASGACSQSTLAHEADSVGGLDAGGELQRFCIARALAPQTQFLIADEMTTMLDVITQAQIWEFLLKETAERNIGLLAVTHNLSLASRICTRVIDLSRIQDGSAS